MRIPSRALEVVLLAAAVIMVPLAWEAIRSWAGAPTNYNDFHHYWLAGKLISLHQSPYDMDALRGLARAEDFAFSVGGGYQYPLPFALAMVPLAALPFGTALLLFNAVSLAAFGLTVALWLGWAHGWAPELRPRRFALALLAGLYPPVYGSLSNGQVNLLLCPLLALGAVAALDGRPAQRFWGGVLVGFSAVVKLVPGVLVVPLALGRRLGAGLGIVVGAGSAMGLALLAAPWANEGSGGLASLLDADTYYTNQSLNGFVSRLVHDSGRTVALWDHGFDPGPVMLGVTAAFGLLTLAILWRARGALVDRRGIALGMGLALSAGIVGAPKESTWNQAIALVAVGLLLAVETPDLRLGRLGRVDLGLLAVWFGAALLWAIVWGLDLRAGAFGPAGPIVTLLWSSSLYSMLALWWLFVRRLARHAREAVQSGA
jgi:alpha-1,2-mannosyltransferase